MPHSAGSIRNHVRTLRTANTASRGVSAADVQTASTFLADRARASLERHIDKAFAQDVSPYGAGPGGRRHVITVPVVDLGAEFQSGNDPHIEGPVRAALHDAAASQQVLAAVTAKLAEGGFRIELAADSDAPGVWRAFVSDPIYVRELFPDDAFEHGDVAFRLEGTYKFHSMSERVAVIPMKQGEALAVKAMVDAREPRGFRVKIWSHAPGSTPVDHRIDVAPQHAMAGDHLSSS